MVVALFACGGGGQSLGEGDCSAGRCPEQCIDETGRRYEADGTRTMGAASGHCGSGICNFGDQCGKAAGQQPSCYGQGVAGAGLHVCVAKLNCGSLNCVEGCMCSDAATSTCACP